MNFDDITLHLNNNLFWLWMFVDRSSIAMRSQAPFTQETKAEQFRLDPRPASYCLGLQAYIWA